MRDRKYGEVTLENPRNIGPDEPLFLFRYKDAMLPEALIAYRAACKVAGSPQNHLDRISDALQEVLVWQRDHGNHVPTSKGYTA